MFLQIQFRFVKLPSRINLEHPKELSKTHYPYNLSLAVSIYYPSGLCSQGFLMGAVLWDEVSPALKH